MKNKFQYNKAPVYFPGFGSGGTSTGGGGVGSGSVNKSNMNIGKDLLNSRYKMQYFNVMTIAQGFNVIAIVYLKKNYFCWLCRTLNDILCKPAITHGQGEVIIKWY